MIRSRTARARLAQALFTGLGGAALAALLWFSGLLAPWEAKTWDWRARLMAQPSAQSEQVCVILLDQASLDWGEEEQGLSWPWPREVHAAIIDFCGRAGAKCVALDVLFSETSLWGVSDDAALGRAMAEFGSVAQAMALGRRDAEPGPWPVQVPEPGFRVVGLDAWLDSPRAQGVAFGGASFPVPEVAASAEVLANVSEQPDEDGVYRRIRLLSTYNGRVLPNLGLAAYIAAHPGADMAVRPGAFTLDGREFPLNERGETLLTYAGPSGTHATYAAAAVIQSELRLRSGQEPLIDPAQLAGKYVLFGFSAPGLMDLRAAPVSGVYPGVEIHATALDNLLSGAAMAELPAWATVLLLLAAGLAGSAVFTAQGSAVRGMLLTAALVLVAAGASLAAYKAGLWYPLVAQELALLLAASLALAASHATEGRQRRFLKSAFSQYLSPAVIEELIQHPERLRLGGERRELSIFFSDLEGFTSISERMEPEDLTALLNDYLSAMTAIIHEQGGTVDKYEGDAIIAFWNAPVDQEEHAERAVTAALLCQKRLAELRPEFAARTGKELRMRIGVNTGMAVVGNLGSDTRFDYTMLGDAVNLAARLEGANKHFGTYTMISEAACKAMHGAHPVRELGRVAVVGRKEPVRVFEPLLAQDAAARREDLETFAKALEAYNQGRFSDAQQGFSTLAGRDPAAAFYARHAQDLAEDDSDYGGGVLRLRSK